MAKINKSQKDKIKKFKDITEIIRSSKSKKDTQYNRQKRYKTIHGKA